MCGTHRPPGAPWTEKKVPAAERHQCDNGFPLVFPVCSQRGKPHTNREGLLEGEGREEGKASLFRDRDAADAVMESWFPARNKQKASVDISVGTP